MREAFDDGFGMVARDALTGVSTEVSTGVFPSTESARLYSACTLCPRACGVNRRDGERGYCRASADVEVARAALHFWEEPPISGSAGSGTVFFTHCSLCCSYCQNAVIARGGRGRVVALDELVDMMLDLQRQGARNINLVTATHYAPSVRDAVAQARMRGLALPIVWNTSGYETVEAVRDNASTVDVYLTDFKYASSDMARLFSSAPDYPEVALSALRAMLEETGSPVFDEVDGEPRLIRGVVVRHLILPGHLDESCKVVRLLYDRFGDAIAYSLMNQYTPVLNTAAKRGDVNAVCTLRTHPELGRTVDDEEYERLLDFADGLGIDEYYWQDGPAQGESFIPDFSPTAD